MEGLLLTGIGTGAFSYAAYLAWRVMRGKEPCGCGSSGGSCQNNCSKGCCGAQRSK